MKLIKNFSLNNSTVLLKKNKYGTRLINIYKLRIFQQQQNCFKQKVK